MADIMAIQYGHYLAIQGDVIMEKTEPFYPNVPDALWARAVGEKMLEVAKAQEWQQAVNSLAVRLLEEIQAILDDDSLDDAACFGHMEELLAKWNQAGLYTTRHSETE